MDLDKYGYHGRSFGTLVCFFDRDGDFVPEAFTLNPHDSDATIEDQIYSFAYERAHGSIDCHKLRLPLTAKWQALPASGSILGGWSGILERISSTRPDLDNMSPVNLDHGTLFQFVKRPAGLAFVPGRIYRAARSPRQGEKLGFFDDHAALAKFHRSSSFITFGDFEHEIVKTVTEEEIAVQEAKEKRERDAAVPKPPLRPELKALVGALLAHQNATDVVLQKYKDEDIPGELPDHEALIVAIAMLEAEGRMINAEVCEAACNTLVYMLDQILKK